MDDIKKYFDPSTTPCPTSPVAFDAGQYVLFILTMVGMFHLIQSYNKRRNFEYRERSTKVWTEDIVKLVTLSTLVFILGNYSNTFNLITVTSLLVGSVLFAEFSNIPALKSSLLDFTKNAQTTTAYTFMFLLILGVLVYLGLIYYNCYHNHHMVLYLGLLLSLVVSLFVVGGDESVHIHHWNIGFFLSFLTRFNNPVSNMAAGLFLSFMVYGIATYGADDMIEDVNDNKENKGKCEYDFGQILKYDNWVLVYSDTCPACKKQEKEFDFNSYINLNKTTCLDNPDFCQRYEIQSVPSWVNTMTGKVNEGFKTKSELIEMLRYGK